MDLDRAVRLVARLRGEHPYALIFPANHGYPADALSSLGACRDQRPAWIEEPCSADGLLGRVEIVTKAGIPVLGHETCRTPGEVAAQVLGRRCTTITIKLARSGIRASTWIGEFWSSVGALLLAGSQRDSGIVTHASAAFARRQAATSP